MPYKLFISITIAYILLLVPYRGSGQEKVRFNRLSVEEGLSQISVLSIVQDNSGYIWLGTRYGLNKYDANKIKVYKNQKNDTSSLSGNEYIGTSLFDSKGVLWVGTSRGLNKYISLSDSFKQILNDPSNPKGLSSNFINKVFEDKKGNIWVATRRGLNLLVDKQELTFSKFLKQHNIFTIAYAKDADMWLGTSGGLVRVSASKEKYHFIRYEKISRYLNKVSENDIVALCADGDYLWIGTSKMGLICYDTLKDTFSRYTTEGNSPLRISSNNIRKILLAKNGELWIGTQKGVNVLDIKRSKIIIHQYNADDNTSLSQNSVYDIYQDKQGIMWIGTYYGGANIVYPVNDSFNIYRNQNNVNSISSNVISSIAQDKMGNLWIGTEAEGLNHYSSANNKFVRYKNNPSNPNSLSSNLVKTVYIDDDDLWIGTHQGGLDFFDPKNQQFKHYKDHRGPTSINVNFILQDSKKRFWVGTGNGLRMFDKKTGVFSTYNANLHQNSLVTSSVIDYIFEDSKKNIWVGGTSGVHLLKNENTQFTYIDLGKHVDLPSNNVTSIGEDAFGDIWIGTFQGGIVKYEILKNKFTCYTTIDGLAGNSVLGFLEEKPGVLWVSTNNGLSRFDVKNKVFRNYNVYDRLPGNVFNIRSFFKDLNGKMYFGGFEGLVSFFPEQIKINHYSPDVIFTDIKLFNKSLPANSLYRIIDNDKNQKQLNLEYDHNVVSLEFTNLNYISPKKNSYAYYLDGFEKTWNFTSQSSVTYTNLSDGTYKLKVKGLNNDGIWSKNVSELIIVVAPPVWRTWWAYLIYATILAAICFGVIRFLLIRALLRREKEAHQMKLDFFTNVSHEIRTPLTLIVAPLEKMLAQPDKPIKQRQLKFIKDNADRLIRLVTELLDFRKAETGHLELKVIEDDIVAFARHVSHYFYDIALIRNITYGFSASHESIKLHFDHEQMEKVLFNLLSNAFKFVHDGGKVTLTIIDDDKKVNMLIEDNGVGIPKDKQKYLFTQFFQASPDKMGSGVGLALCKNIVDLHHGNITIESSPHSNKENGFTAVKVCLRKGIKHFRQDQLIEISTKEFVPKQVTQATTDVDTTSLDLAKTGLKTILVVEDNDDMRLFICESLEEQYNVLAAENGAEGIQIAFKNLPDLIVSDVMMPETDGLELCNILKNDARTSNIPIILLTARVDDSHQLIGVKAGADLYMAKPFSVELLHANIKNLLGIRENMMQKFSKIVKLDPTNVVIASAEEAFINKIMKLIESNISDPCFNVPWIAEQMGMSQPILYKKLRTLTNLSVNDFIKSTRLKRATDLLSQKVFNVSEVAYQVGFSDPRYFAKEFRKQYGMSPTDFIKQIVDEKP